MAADRENLWRWETSPCRLLYAFLDESGTQIRWPDLHAADRTVDPDAWYVENDSYGWMIYLAGHRFARPAQCAHGLAILQTAVDGQHDSGGYGGLDGHHSAAFFYELLARFLILAPMAGFTDDALLAHWRTTLRRGAIWFADPANWDDHWWRDAMHHRFFLNSTVLYLAAAAIDGLPSDCIEQANSWLATGIQRQRPDGAVTENGGHDTGYHSLALTFGCGSWLSGTVPVSLQGDLRASMMRAADWLISRVDEHGYIDASGNTRMSPDSGEESRLDGTAKAIKPHESAFALRGASIAFARDDCQDVATRIMNATRRVAGGTRPPATSG